MDEYYNGHGIHGLAKIERDEFFKLFDEAKTHGIETGTREVSVFVFGIQVMG